MYYVYIRARGSCGMEEEWIEVASEEAVSSHVAVEDFWSAVDVWVRRPQVVNRRVLGAVILWEGPEGEGAWPADPTKHLDGEVSEGCDKTTSSGCGLNAARVDLSGGHSDVIDAAAENHVTIMDDHVTCGDSHVIGKQRWIVRELLPRMRKMTNAREAILIDEEQQSATFFPLPSDREPVSPCDPRTLITDPRTLISHGLVASYRLNYHHQSASDGSSVRISLTLPSTSASLPSNGITSPSADWLVTTLLPKIAKWTQESAASASGSGARGSSKTQSLVPLDKYCQLYRELKEKYGPPLVANWPEATDPHKFVYEDIAIATYLLVLWEEERKRDGVERKQTFVDLGCGNGLLVYLLSSEGHPGKGIDVRERRIWRMLKGKAKLEVESLTPSDQTLFPDSDWLIGNHSDELTPWVPLMAARSSYRTKYFVLPCCPYDFEGKFCRPTTHQSQYRSYLDYVRLIGETVGFVVQEDILRIPSSKRVCQVGGQRSYQPEVEQLIEARRKRLLEERCSSRKGTGGRPNMEGVNAGEDLDERVCGEGIGVDPSLHDERGDLGTAAGLELRGKPGEVGLDLSVGGQGSGSAWTAGFRPRAADECVRNGSHVDSSVKEVVVQTLTTALLKMENMIEIPKEGLQENSTKHLWNRGGRIHLKEAARLFNPALLHVMKQCSGGLQTLLRNHHQIFKVTGGYIQLRDWSLRKHPGRKPPKPRSERDSQLLVKTKLCWFDQFHPQGCPRAAVECPYAHGASELRQRPDFDGIATETPLLEL